MLLWGVIALHLCKSCGTKVYLYKFGETTEAFVCSRVNAYRFDESLYEFEVNGIKYIGYDRKAKVGSHIEVIYSHNAP